VWFNVQLKCLNVQMPEDAKEGARSEFYCICFTI